MDSAINGDLVAADAVIPRGGEGVKVDLSTPVHPRMDWALPGQSSEVMPSTTVYGCEHAYFL